MNIPYVLCRKKVRHESDDYFAPSKGTSLLSSEVEELAGIFYRPRTKETKASYEILLSFIQQSIGDQVCTLLPCPMQIISCPLPAHSL